MRSETKSGIVYLIGGGPGDVGLITVKGLECLKKCDVVIYDHLIPLELLYQTPSDAELIDASKHSGKHKLKQDEINQLLVDYANKGKIVCRLKGGDPFIFGRGGEEALFLKQYGVPFEIVPGITAGSAVPSFAGIPITHRGMVTQTVFVTAHEADLKSIGQVDWELLAKLRSASIIGYMGVKTLQNVVGKLIKSGLPPDTDVAVISRGCSPAQKTVVGTLGNIIDVVSKAGITPPAIFVVGETVKLRENLKWYENKLLFGRRIVITRAVGQSQELTADLRELGAEVILFPTIATEYYADEKLQSVIDSGAKYDWIIFTSANGVRYFFDALAECKSDIRKFRKAKIAVVGAGTDRALTEKFIKSDFTPQRYLTSELAEELHKRFGVSGNKILRVRGDTAPSTVEDIFEGYGAAVETLTVYRIIVGKPIPGIRKKLLEDGADLITFTSPSTVRNFVEIIGMDNAKMILSKADILSIGPITSEAVRQFGLTVDVEASPHSIKGIISAIVKWRNGKGDS